MRKRGETLAPFTLMEVVLAILVLASICLTLYSIISSASFYQMFFAKDNAYIAESLHAAPNGEMHFGYLWPNKNFLLTLDKSSTTVSYTQKTFLVKANPRQKYFGTSTSVKVEPNSFAPQTFEWVLTSQKVRGITVDQTFLATSTCPPSQQPLSGIAVSGTEEGFDPGTAQKRIESAQENARTALQPKNIVLADTGLTVRFHAIKSDGARSTQIITSDHNDLTKRLSCLLAQAAGTTAVPVASAKPPLNAGGYDIAIVIQGNETDQLDIVSGIVRNAVLAYTAGETT